MIVNPSVSSETFRCRNSVSGKVNIPATCTTNYNRIQRPQSPLTRNHIKTSGHFAAQQTPIISRTSNSVLSSNVNEGPQKSDLETTPKHVPALENQAKPSSTGQQLPIPCLPQNPPPRGHAISDEAPSLESSSTSEHNPPVGFFTARAAETLQSGPGLPVKAPAFDPHLESPSIRKTAGIDHTKTKPVGREAVGAPLLPTVPRANFVNPQSDKTRRVGMPMVAASPLQNRGSYKPPQMKRAVESGPRFALGEVTNVVSDAGDVKRQRVGLEAQDLYSNEGLLGS